MIHDFDEVIVFSENLAHLAGNSLGLVILTESQAHLNLATGAARSGNCALGILVQQLAVDSRFVVDSLEPRVRRHLEEIVHSLGCFAEQSHVGVCAVTRDVVVAAIAPANR